VLAQAVVGPYDTVQLQSTDPTALETWLTANGFVIPASVQPIITAYVNEGFDFLAMRLAPGQGVQAMRPVSVTSPGAGVSLPLRMVAAGAGATVGITLWVVADGRYQPQNFQTFSVDPSELTWDWSLGGSDYTTVRANKEAALANAGWQTESSLEVSPDTVESLVLADPAASDYTALPPVGAGEGGAGEAGAGEGGASESGIGEAGAGQTADDVRMQDLATIFPTGGTSVRITRMRADLTQAALANDLVLEAPLDQSILSNVYSVTQSVNAPVCPTYPPCSASAPCPQCPSDFAGTSGSGGTSTSGTNTRGTFGCATTGSEASGSGVQLTLAGLVAFSLVRAGFKRRGRRREN
jgi:hypothetical protein